MQASFRAGSGLGPSPHLANIPISGVDHAAARVLLDKAQLAVLVAIALHRQDRSETATRGVMASRLLPAVGHPGGAQYPPTG
jgi:hypothetical protein